MEKTIRRKLRGVHPRLVDIVVEFVRARGEYRIRGFLGVRSQEQQNFFLRNGFSRVTNSKHLIQQDGFGHAVDLYPQNHLEYSNSQWLKLCKDFLEFAKRRGLILKSGLLDWGWDAYHFEILEFLDLESKEKD